jgi:hypothetical protein
VAGSSLAGGSRKTDWSERSCRARAVLGPKLMERREVVERPLCELFRDLQFADMVCNIQIGMMPILVRGDKFLKLCHSHAAGSGSVQFHGRD